MMTNRPTAKILAALALAGTTACTPNAQQVSRQPVSEPKADTLVQGIAAQECLTEAIYFEAGTHSDRGRAAVAHVILNRVADPRFPGSVCGVVQEGEATGACQFSYRCQMDTSVIRWPSKMAAARATALPVLAGETPDPTQGALFFHAASIAPGWFSTRVERGTFGGNVFYL